MLRAARPSARLRGQPAVDGMTAPFTYDASSDIRNRTTAGHLLERAPPGPSGRLVEVVARAPRSVRCEVISVSSSPGQIAFTVMPLRAHLAGERLRQADERRSSWRRRRSGRRCRGGPPPRTCSRSGPTCARSIAAQRRPAAEERAAHVRGHRLRRTSSIGYLSSSPSCDIPALLTRPVTGPSSSATARKASVTEASSVTSRCTAMPGLPRVLERRRPSPSRRPRSSGSRSRPSSRRAASASAHARPIPREPPVTTATFRRASVMRRAPAPSSASGWRPRRGRRRTTSAGRGRPRRTRPARHARSRAIGIDAAEVFPTSSTSTTARSSGIARRSATAIMMRAFAWWGISRSTSSGV